MATVDWDGLGGDLLSGIFTEEAAERRPDFGDRYEVRDAIGKGGQGIVFAAYDRVLEREVAIKRLHDPGAPQQPLRNEARILSRLAHPAIPQVYDQGRSPDGGWYMVMQRIDGGRLQRALRDGGLDAAARLRLFRSVAGAVAHAHRHGILHRDLKPENILVADAGEPYIVDWGLAANGGPRGVCGSPHFAAPEQLDGQVADRRVDVFALGVLLYYILSGQLPYGRPVRDFHEFRQVRAGLQRIPLRRRCPALAPALERVCDRAMSAQPAARYPTVDDLIADLDAIQGGRPLAKDLPRLPWRRMLLVVVVLLVAGGGVLVGRMSSTAGADGPAVSPPVARPAIPALPAPPLVVRPPPPLAPFRTRPDEGPITGMVPAFPIGPLAGRHAISELAPGGDDGTEPAAAAGEAPEAVEPVQTTTSPGLHLRSIDELMQDLPKPEEVGDPPQDEALPLHLPDPAGLDAAR